MGSFLCSFVLCFFFLVVRLRRREVFVKASFLQGLSYRICLSFGVFCRSSNWQLTLFVFLLLLHSIRIFTTSTGFVMSEFQKKYETEFVTLKLRLVSHRVRPYAHSESVCRSLRVFSVSMLIKKQEIGGARGSVGTNHKRTNGHVMFPTTILIGMALPIIIRCSSGEATFLMCDYRNRTVPDILSASRFAFLRRIGIIST